MHVTGFNCCQNVPQLRGYLGLWTLECMPRLQEETSVDVWVHRVHPLFGEIADNGAIAVDAFKRRIAESKPFDIILVGFRSHTLFFV